MGLDHEFALVLTLDDASASLEQVGGKGASLARLAAAGLPVPPGFHLTTAAYRRFVAANALQDRIMDAVVDIDADQPASLEAAAQRIAELFAHGVMPSDVAQAIGQAYRSLGGGERPVAVRSSATAEDLPGMSFAGQQETYLNMRGESMILDAVQRCWASLWTARAIVYRARHGIRPQDVSLAVVVQELVPADAAGILFTVNPLDGASDRVVINASWGLGEAIVGGQVTPDTVVVDKASGKILEQQINEKTVMTVRTPKGTREESVPLERRTQAVLSSAQAVELARLGMKIEAVYDQPMDIEWALYEDHFFILQARPIAALHGHNPSQGEWNDSLSGDYLWTNANLGEAIPDVMTPCTWSLVQLFMTDAMATSSVPPYFAYGNIGGRFYMNLSVAASLAAAFGISGRRFAKTTQPVFGRLPDGMEIPSIPLSRLRIVLLLLPVITRMLRRVRGSQKRLPAFLAGVPSRCDALHAQIRVVSSATDLAALWENDLAPFFHECCYMLEAAGRQDGSALIMVRSMLEKMVGEADANALLTGLSEGNDHLASLGLLVGLTQLASGETDRASFARQYGHRSPHEFEVSIPRPAEDPGWIDQQLAGLSEAKESLDSLLERQVRARDDAWERFRKRYPGKEARIRRQIQRWAKVARSREVARSEVIRVFWMLRAFVLRAGQLTGHGDDLFYLSIDEILALLRGEDDAPLAHLSARRSAYTSYCTLPPYPALIRGHFDPFRWAADPHRRSDLFDEHGAKMAASSDISGFTGAPGVVEGRVRVALNPEDGDQLQAGEILVTVVTNVGWTPLFPRAAAVVTDVGAPLSHAAIVARELGIPAVVGCGNATMRLHTGDWVRVDGRQGKVEILRKANDLATQEG